MNTRTLTAIALLLAAIPAASFAQGAGQMPRPTPPVFDFATADADASGGISAEEWTAYAGGLRDVMRVEMMAARADALIAAGDGDGDGALGRDELIGGMTALGDERRGAMGERFGMMRHHGERDGMRGHGRGHDRGHDWGFGRGEMRGDGEGRGEMRGPMAGGRGGDGAGPEGRPGAMGFARIDADGDGQINAEELAHAQEMVNWMASRPRRN